MNYEIEYKGQLHKVRFQHTRELSTNQKILTKGGSTLAYILFDNEGNPATQETSPKWCISALAECSPKDFYDKRLGRVISMGRLKQIISKGFAEPFLLEEEK